MTIRTKEPEVPTEFPPARLFLDDIEEIVHILVTATAVAREGWTAPHEDQQIKVTFTIKDQICDEVDELPKIARKTTRLYITTEEQEPGPAIRITFGRNGSYLGSYGLSAEAQLGLYRKLAPVFKRRNLWFRTLIHSHFAFLAGVSLGTFTVGIMILLITLTLLLTLNKHIPPIPLALTTLLAVLFPIAVFSTARYHSIVIFRHSSQPSLLQQELLQKFPLAAVTSILTFLLTVLGFYIKHKYWP